MRCVNLQGTFYTKLYFMLVYIFFYIQHIQLFYSIKYLNTLIKNN